MKLESRSLSVAPDPLLCTFLSFVDSLLLHLRGIYTVIPLLENCAHEALDGYEKRLRERLEEDLSIASVSSRWAVASQA
eukprot:334796-Amphidinium_carterae.1